MTDKEFYEFLENNKAAVDKAVQEFRHHSLEFDKKMAKILASL